MDVGIPVLHAGELGLEVDHPLLEGGEELVLARIHAGHGESLGEPWRDGEALTAGLLLRLEAPQVEEEANPRALQAPDRTEPRADLFLRKVEAARLEAGRQALELPLEALPLPTPAVDRAPEDSELLLVVAPRELLVVVGHGLQHRAGHPSRQVGVGRDRGQKDGLVVPGGGRRDRGADRLRIEDEALGLQRVRRLPADGQAGKQSDLLVERVHRDGRDVFGVQVSEFDRALRDPGEDRGPIGQRPPHPQVGGVGGDHHQEYEQHLPPALSQDAEVVPEFHGIANTVPICR